jgi:4-hydroxy-3-methylbut-2-enyl diphosphate reductase
LAPPEPTTRQDRQHLTVLLASPRGFCAGVDRAIAIVKEALRKNGAPVYVRHEIVHNRHVVEELKELGAVFVEELVEVPDDAVVVFSAHGVPKSVPAEAKRRASSTPTRPARWSPRSTARSRATTAPAARCC